MKRSHVLATAALGACVSILLPTESVTAQSIWLDQRHEKGITLEVLKPSFDGEGVSLLTSALYLSARYPISPGVLLTAEVPVSRFGLTGSFADRSETTIGNPYVGARMQGAGTPWGWAIGVRVPVTPDDNMGGLTGVLGDFDRFEAFAVKQLTVVTEISHLYENPSGFSARVRLSPAVLIPMESDRGDSEVLLSYNAMGWYDARVIRVGGGFSGRMLVTDPDMSLGDRSVHQAGISVIGGFYNVQPGLHLRVPLDDNLSAMNFVVGLNLTVLLR